MLDWYMLLAPLLVLPIILLFAFVGCSLEDTGEAEGLAIVLQWKNDLGPDVSKISVRAVINSNTYTNKEGTKETSSPESLHGATPDAPSGLVIPFPKQSPEYVACDLYCTFFDMSGEFTIWGFKEGVPGGEGRAWDFELLQSPGGDQPFVIEFTEEKK